MRLLAFTANFVDGQGEKLSVTSVNFVTWYINFIQARQWQYLAIIADGSALAKTMVYRVANTNAQYWAELDQENIEAGIILPAATPIDAFRFLLDSVLLHEVSWASQGLRWVQIC